MLLTLAGAIATLFLLYWYVASSKASVSRAALFLRYHSKAKHYIAEAESRPRVEFANQMAHQTLKKSHFDPKTRARVKEVTHHHLQRCGGSTRQLIEKAHSRGLKR
ncbi:hypothetical protein [Aestuariirhabdus sp. LZHN29]|uniref:hypothetical protein n=1 Tax=Aestuariirhabdus sp. LZHN29 TaxID=3417462 RepID=UPI003CF9D398